jgi:hypothetical protein
MPAVLGAGGALGSLAACTETASPQALSAMHNTSASTLAVVERRRDMVGAPPQDGDKLLETIGEYRICKIIVDNRGVVDRTAC